MAKQIKPKYPADREKQSQAFANSEVHTDVMTTHPRVIITIRGEHSEELVADLQNAIDEVLNFHGS